MSVCFTKLVTTVRHCWDAEVDGLGYNFTQAGIVKCLYISLPTQHCAQGFVFLSLELREESHSEQSKLVLPNHS